MNASAFYSLLLFTFVYSITPGPNNLLLAASGAAFGYRRSLPHILGVSLGAALMLVVVGCGLCTVFERIPQLHTVLRYVGALYLVWLAWCIARSGSAGGGAATPMPLRFWQGVALQWVNPKTWVMAVGIAAAHTPRENHFVHLLMAGLLLVVVSFPSISAWTLFGQCVACALRSPVAVHRFNLAMAGLLLLSLYPFCVEAWQRLCA